MRPLARRGLESNLWASFSGSAVLCFAPALRVPPWPLQAQIAPKGFLSARQHGPEPIASY